MNLKFGSKGVAFRAVAHHNEIANNYTNMIPTALLGLFPNLSAQHAQALSWVGLFKDSWAYQEIPLSVRNQWTSIEINYREKRVGTVPTGNCP